MSPDVTDLHEVSLDELIESLTAFKSKNPKVKWSVRIPYTNHPPSCIGATAGVPREDGTGIIYLFPCPEDIDAITRVRKLFTMMSCDKAYKGQDCRTCTSILTCNVMKQFEDNMKIVHEGS